MLVVRRYCLPLVMLLLCSCQPPKQKETIKQAVTNTPTDIAEPDVIYARARLFQFFETHKGLDKFDTADYTPSEYWGPRNPPYIVEAGHLFDDEHTHAMVFYSDGYGSGLFIYLKQGEDWMQIFKDTATGIQDGGSPDFEDWNGDGIRDMTIFHLSPIMMSVIDTRDMWLMDKNMKTLHAIPEFPKIENPAIDSTRKGYVIGSLYYHGLKTTRYRFRDYKLVKVSEVWDRDE